MALCVKQCYHFGRMFRIPSDPTRRTQWCNALNLEPTNKVNLYVCSQHFSEVMFCNTNLKRSAYPDINLDAEVNHESPTKEQLKELLIKHQKETEQHQKDMARQKKNVLKQRKIMDMQRRTIERQEAKIALLQQKIEEKEQKIESQQQQLNQQKDVMRVREKDFIKEQDAHWRTKKLLEVSGLCTKADAVAPTKRYTKH